MKQASELGPDGKKHFVTGMFSGIASHYDLVNSITSLCLDRYWRLKTVQALGAKANQTVLDLCAGTLPLTARALRSGATRLIALDISPNMLRAGMSRAFKWKGKVYPICGDSELLPLRDQSVDGIVIAFGIRNLSNLTRAFSEMYRVLRPGGGLALVEFSVPTNFVISRLYLIYLKLFLIPVGTLFTGDRQAYQYLAESIFKFPAPSEICTLISKTGFSHVRAHPLTLGLVTLYRASKIFTNRNSYDIASI